MPTKCWSNKQNNKCINKTNKCKNKTNKCINKHMYEHTISYKLCDRHAASVQMPNKTDETNKRGADYHWDGQASISSILEMRRKISCCFCYVCFMYVLCTHCVRCVVMFVLCILCTHCVRCCCYVCVMYIAYTLCTPAADSHPPPPSTGSHLLSPFALNQLIKAVSNAPLPDGMFFVAFLKIRRTYTPEKSIELWRNFLPTKQR